MTAAPNDGWSTYASAENMIMSSSVHPRSSISFFVVGRKSVSCGIWFMVNGNKEEQWRIYICIYVCICVCVWNREWGRGAVLVLPTGGAPVQYAGVTHRGYECYSAGSGMSSAGVCPVSSHDSRYIIMRLCSPRAFILGW